MGDESSQGDRTQRRGKASLLRLAFATVAIGIVIYVIAGFMLYPPDTVHYRGRVYRLSEPWGEFQARFPDTIPDPADMQRTWVFPIPARGVLVDGPVSAGQTHTVICVQSLDGRYWGYSLSGGP